MAMKVRAFVDRLNAVKASVKAGEGSPEIEAGLARVVAHLKQALSPEELKALIASDGEVSTILEEDLTTLTMEWMRHRGGA